MGEVIRLGSMRKTPRAFWAVPLVLVGFTSVAIMATAMRPGSPHQDVRMIYPGQGAARAVQTADLTCRNPRIIDGDTLDCGGERVRLHSIDAPELPGHCAAGRACTPGNPYAARDALRQLTRGNITCTRSGTDRYGRTIAECFAGGVNIECAMVADGHAVPRYGTLHC